MGKKGLIVLGAGGHFKSCQDVIEQEGKFQIADIIEEMDEQRLPALIKKHKYALIAIGQVESPQVRVLKFEYLKSLGALFPVIVSPLAHVSRGALVGGGTIVMHMAVINAGAVVGKNCIINTSAVIEHDACIGDHCHISTGSVVNGSCRIGQGVFIGSNVVLNHNVSVCDGVVIGAGSVVIDSIARPGIYAGHPIKTIKPVKRR
jgi:sugar O-acyltransferase (sialic acid O-acetyltransferase NeuD family)